MRVVFSHGARNDLRAIVDYVIERQRSAAHALVPALRGFYLLDISIGGKLRPCV